MKKKYLNRPLRPTTHGFFGAGLCLLVAAPGLVQAQMSPAYTLPLNGTTQYAGVPNNSALEFATGTVEMWVKPTWTPYSLNGANPSFAAERTPSGNATRFSLHITDGLDAIGIWNNGAWQKIAYSFTQGQWYHVAAVMTTSNTQFYVNGSLVGTTNNGINTSITGTNLTLGTSAPSATPEYFKGEIDEVRVWNTARSASQISANKSVAIANPATAAGLVGYYPIDQNITDFSNAKPALLKGYAANSLDGQLYNYWVPVITGITPTSGLVGTQVVVSGTNLAALTSVSVNGTLATTYSAAANTATADLTVTVPAGATSGTIRVNSSTSGAGTSAQAFTVLTDLTVSNSQALSGNYNNVTVLSGGQLLLTGPLNVAGTLMVQAGGQLNLKSNAVTGNSFVLAPGGTLSIGGIDGIAATGSTGGIQTTTRSFAADANYVYGSYQPGAITGTGLPAQVRSLSIVDLYGDGEAYLQLTNNLAISQVLRLDYDLITNGKTLTLRSTPTAGSALVYNNGGVVQGTATVQRAIDPTLNSGLGYRQFSAPVGNTTVADLATAGFAPVVNPAYNTSAAPTSETPFPTVYGYDQSRLALTNNLTGFDKGWVSPASLSEALTVGRGYTVNIGASEVVDFVGTLTTGDQAPLALSRASGSADAGWQLLGNPYPAPLDLSLVAPADRPNLDAAMYVSQSLGQYSTQYRTYVNGLSTSGTNNSIVPSGQGFFARVSAGQPSGSFTFRDSQRLTTFDATTSVQRPTADARPQVHLALRGAGAASDAAIVYFENGATAGLDAQYDAAKLPNTTGLNLSTAAAGQTLAIDGRPLPTGALTIPLNVYVPTTGTYTLEASQLLNLNGLHPYLRDTQLGTLTDLTQQPSYSFSQNAAFLGARFELVLTPAQPLAATAATQAQIAVYPSPARTLAYVELPAALGAQPVAATLLDALGREVRTTTLAAQGAQAHQLGLAGLPAGVYALRLRTSAGVVAKKLVIE
ncbi:MAG: T9SS type A sorting domain-containing protein [Cytophagaceae bacterium]|nr:MAG: T9SS type A sorting domain-containing protein [Cytophagaceae bacterium]